MILSKRSSKLSISKIVQYFSFSEIINCVANSLEQPTAIHENCNIGSDRNITSTHLRDDSKNFFPSEI